MAYFVTGATGFIGRHLMVRLLAHREGEIYVLVRKGSAGRLKELSEHYWPPRVAEELARAAPAGRPAAGQAAGDADADATQAPPSGATGAGLAKGTRALSPAERIHPVIGDLAAPMLGVDTELALALRGSIEHFFHLAALYDLTASAKLNTELNIGGTSAALDLARTLEAGQFHHVSSIAVAGTYHGRFSETMFDAGQRLPTPYHRTKFEAERAVRDQPYVPWRIYRPGIVVGDSRTGEMDKVDGPYYFFKAIQRMHTLPDWLPLVGVDVGRTNIVPVDWVADALDHIAHEDGLDGRAFHLTDPVGQRIEGVVNQLAEIAGAPRFALSIDRRLVDLVPKRPLSLLLRVPPLHQLTGLALRELGIPEQVIENMALVPELDTVLTQQALAGTGLERPPELARYLPRLWEYWEREMDRKVDHRRTLRQAIEGRHVIITGASSGIGRASARKIAAAGGIPLLVARDVERLEQTRAEIVAGGGIAYVYSADLSDMEDVDRLLARIFADHQSVEALVNNAGRSIRRSVALSYDRFHDFERTMQLNYFGAIKLILGLLPHMRERRQGHIVNISTIGAQTFPPRFAAYVASKAALDAFTRVVAAEVVGDGVTFTTIHMPLVRTPMIEPTKMYRAFPAIAPEEAAAMICEGLRSQPKQIGTRLGTTSEVLYALAPKAVDRILHMGYRVFPDSAAAKGERTVEEPPTLEQLAMATLTRGVHW